MHGYYPVFGIGFEHEFRDRRDHVLCFAAHDVNRRRRRFEEILKPAHKLAVLGLDARAEYNAHELFAHF